VNPARLYASAGATHLKARGSQTRSILACHADRALYLGRPRGDAYNLAGITTALPTAIKVLRFPARNPDWGPRGHPAKAEYCRWRRDCRFFEGNDGFRRGSARVSMFGKQGLNAVFSRGRKFRISIEEQTGGFSSHNYGALEKESTPVIALVTMSRYSIFYRCTLRAEKAIAVTPWCTICQVTDDSVERQEGGGRRRWVTLATSHLRPGELQALLTAGKTNSRANDLPTVLATNSRQRGGPQRPRTTRASGYCRKPGRTSALS